MVKNLPANAEDTGSERCPGVRNGNPPQYSRLGNPGQRSRCLGLWKRWTWLRDRTTIKRHILYRAITQGKGLLIISESEAAQSCPTLCDPMDCSPPGSSIHGILQARILERAASSFSRGSSRPRDRTQVSRIVGRRFNLWATREALISNDLF